MEQVSKGQFTSYAWVIVAVTFLAGITAPANMAKVMALAPVLMEAYEFGPDVLGLVIAIFFLLGVILAIPAAAIIRRLGVRVAVIISIVLGVIGSLLGAVTADLTLFIVSRFCEGAGMGIMAITGAVAITPWFPKEKRGFPLGLWAMWVSLPMAVCPILYGFIVDTLGVNFKVIWWGTMVFDIAALVIFLTLYRTPQHPYNDAEVGDTFAEGEKHKFSDLFKSKPMIGMALIFLFDEMAFMGMQGFMSSYLTNEVHSTLFMATVFVTAFAVTGMIFSPLSGKLSDIFKTRKWIMLTGLICGFILCCLIFTFQLEWLYWPLAILAGIVGAFAPTMIYVATPEVVPGDLIPAGNSLISLTQNLGMLIGALVLGNTITWLGSYTSAAVFTMAPLFIICIVIFFIFVRKMK